MFNDCVPLFVHWFYNVYLFKLLMLLGHATEFSKALQNQMKNNENTTIKTILLGAFVFNIVVISNTPIRCVECCVVIVVISLSKVKCVEFVLYIVGISYTPIIFVDVCFIKKMLICHAPQ